MALVAFKNVAGEESNELQIEGINLLTVVYNYARKQDDDIYKVIVNEKISIFLNDKKIEVDDWYHTKTLNTDKIIVVPDLEGGILKAVVGIALIAAAIWIPGISPIVFKVMLGLGMSMMLGGISDILFKPDLPKLSTDNSRTSQSYSWNGIRTMARQDSPIPVVYGTHKIGGNLLSVFTTSSGINNYIYMLIGLAEGEIEGICKESDHSNVCTTSNPGNANYAFPAIELDEQPLRLFSNVQWWYRTGTNTQSAMTYFDNARVQYEDGRDISTSGIEYQTTKKVDAVSLQIYFPSLYDATSDDGTIVSKEATFAVRWKLYGDSFAASSQATWEPSVAALSGNVTYCTCTTYTDGAYKYGEKYPDYDIKVISNGFVDSITQYNKPYYIKLYVYDTDGNFISTKDVQGIPVEVTTQEYVGVGRGRHLVDVITIKHQISAFTIGDYRVKLSHNVTAGNKFRLSSTQKSGGTSDITVNAKTKSGYWKSVDLDFSTRGIYVIEVKRTDGGATDSFRESNRMLLNSVTEIVDGKFTYPNTALLALKIKATGQLSGSPPNVTTIIKGTKIQVPDIEDSSPSGTDVPFDDCFWDSAAERWEDSSGNEVFWNDTSSWRTEYSNNSMLCVRDIMLNKRYGLGEYIKSSNIYSSKLITAIRECHTAYSESTNDLFSWWTISGDNSDDDWLEKWTNTSEHLTASYDSSARTITITGSTNEFEDTTLDLSLNSTLTYKRVYDLDITITSATKTVETIDVYRISKEGTLSSKIGTLSNKGNGTHTISFTEINSNTKFIRLHIYSNTGLNFVISDVSITPTGTDMRYHTWDGVLESGQSALTVLLEMCDAFRCWPIWYNGEFNFIMDTDDTPVHTLSMSDTIEFSQSFTPISEIPAKLIGQFSSAENDYNLRSIKSISSDNSLMKLNEKTIGLKGLVQRAKAERELINKHNKVTNCTHSISIKCLLPMLHATAGDLLNIQNDLPSWGAGGKILSYNSTNLEIVVDKAYTFPNMVDDYNIKYQTSDNDSMTATVNATSNSVQTLTVESWPTKNPKEFSSYAIGETSNYVKPFRLTHVSRTKENEVECTGIEHISSLYSSEPSLTIVEDNFSNLPNPDGIPKPPINVQVSSLSAFSGMGFSFSANPSPNDLYTTEILIHMSEDNGNSYYYISTILISEGQTQYINNNLQFDYTYYFKFMCKTTKGKISLAEEATCSISSAEYTPNAPSGIRIKQNN